MALVAIKRGIKIVLVTALAAGGGTLGYGLAHQHVASEVYLERLEALAGEYESLREQYNEAVRRTAVTELLVEDGELSVVIRTADGQQRVIPTPFDPNREIWVSYIVADGRLLIRKVFEFDEGAMPSEPVVITPELEFVDWTDPRFEFGKAISRPLSEGRWVVTVSGDGSLALTKATDEPRADLKPAPEIRDYEQIEQKARSEVEQIGPAEVWRRMRQ